MPKYKVKNDTYGFQGRYWTAGQVHHIDHAADDKPPHEHFVRIGGDEDRESDESHEIPSEEIEKAVEGQLAVPKLSPQSKARVGSAKGNQ